MDAGALHQLHDAGHEHIQPVADGVHLHFLALDILVHQHGLVRVDLHGGLEVVPQLLLIGHDLHGPAAQHEAGAHQNGIADLRGGGHAVLDVGDGLSGGLGDVQLLQDLLEGIPVLRPLDGLAVGADDLHPPVHEGLGQVDGRLAAQGGDDALRPSKSRMAMTSSGVRGSK